MLIKEKDCSQATIDRLEELLKQDLPQPKKVAVERELKSIRSGINGEKNSAYYIDFQLKDARNWAVIHDLRIELDGRSAQIDHLVIGRMLEFYVLETKNFASGVSVDHDGAFHYFVGNRPKAMESPIMQNERHIEVLKRLLENSDILPKRLGMRLKPTFKSFILISPKARFTKAKGCKTDTSMVVKADQFIQRFKAENEGVPSLNDFARLTKVVSSETLEGVAKALAAHHQPFDRDYAAQFGIAPETGSGQNAVAEPKVSEDRPAYSSQKSRSGNFCAACQNPISKKVAVFCFTNKKRFGGKAYCFDCQKSIEPA